MSKELKITSKMLEEYGLKFPKKGNTEEEDIKPFEYYRNFIIGPNGGGKTRLLDVIRANAKELYDDNDTHVVFLDFPSLTGKNGKIDETLEVEQALIDFVERGWDKTLSLESFLSYVEAQREKFISGFFKELSSERRGKIITLNRKEILENLNKLLHTFTEITLYPNWVEKEDGESFQATECYRNSESFIKKFNKMSPGERNLFYISLFLSIISVHIKNDPKLVILIDEPELHLHYNVVKEFISKVEEIFKNTPIWVASHSIHLLTHYQFNEITYIEKSKIYRKSSNLYYNIIKAMLGTSENSSDLLFDIESWEYLKFVRQCFKEAIAIDTENKEDPQYVKFIKFLKKNIKDGEKFRILDYGAGKCRFGRMLAEYADKLEYHVFRAEKESLAVLDKNIFKEKWDYNEHDDIPKGHFDIVLLVNTLHEIPLNDWKNVFDKIKDILKKDNGHLFFCEAKVLSIGEHPTGNPPEYGYLVIGKDELMCLFPSLMDEIKDSDKIVSVEIPKKDIQVTEESIEKAIEILRKESLKKAIEEARKTKDEHKSPHRRAFYSIQHTNAVMALEKWKKVKDNFTGHRTYEEFKDHVTKQLNDAKLTENQILFYVWLHAVRALPFLFNKWGQEIWKYEDIQKNLFKFFNILDEIIYIITFNPSTGTKSDVYSDLYNTICQIVIKIDISLSKANSSDINESVDIIFGNDIASIKSKLQLENNKEMYYENNVWSNFETALCLRGCSYWYDWYNKLFNSNFNIELFKDELKYRIYNIPIKIKNNGLKAVAEYMEKNYLQNNK